MQELQAMSVSWIEAQFVKRAVDVLCRCRQILMYSYCFAFYLKKNNHTFIFEVNPPSGPTWLIWQLCCPGQPGRPGDGNRVSVRVPGERHHRRHSHQHEDHGPGQNQVSESPCHQLPLTEVHRYCELRCRAVLEHVYEGYDNDFWEFIE